LNAADSNGISIDVPVLGIEAGHPAGLLPALGPGAQVHGIATFGESGTGPRLLKHFGDTVEAVVARTRAALNGEESALE
jgi:transketolase